MPDNTARRIAHLAETHPREVPAGVAFHAAPQAIEALLSDWNGKARRVEAVLRWLRELQAARATQVLNGEWPPKQEAPDADDRLPCRCRPDGSRCAAVIYHGPGHQSHTHCSVSPNVQHEVHAATYGSYDQQARWRGERVFSGVFDEPPVFREAPDA